MEEFVLVKHTLSDKGRLVSEEVYKNDFKKMFASAPSGDWYESLYIFPEESKQYFETNNNSIAGYNGPAYSNRLFFDLDNKQNPNQTIKDTEELIVRLQSCGIKPESQIRVFFSGQKGFHVEVPINKHLDPIELKDICSNIAKGLESFDNVIYNTTRIVRIKNTRHQVTGLYKIEIEPYDLTQLTIEQIKNKAKEISKGYDGIEAVDFKLLEKYKKTEVKVIPQSIYIEEEGGIRGISDVDFDSCPKDKPRCIHALENGVMEAGVGERSALFLRLASYYRNRGNNKELAYNNLKAIARLNARLYPEADPFTKEELWNNVIKSAYSKNSDFKVVPGASGTDPNNELLKKYCDLTGKYTSKPCCLHGKVLGEKSAIQIDEVAEGFSNFAENFTDNIIPTGIQFIDQYMRLSAGTATLLVGSSGSGKTTLALNILENANSEGHNCLFFSLDSHRNQIYMKLATKCTNFNQDNIFDIYKNKNEHKKQYIKEAVAEKYKLTSFDFSKTLTMEQMRDKVFEVEQRLGDKIKFVLIDYAGRITSQYADSFANAKNNALKAPEMADTTDSAWIILSQISRATGAEAMPLRSKRVAKDSGDWEDSVDNVINCWRPFHGDPERDDVMRVYLAKNRMGQELEGLLRWNGAKSLIKDLTDEEFQEYTELRGLSAEKEYLKSRLNRT